MEPDFDVKENMSWIDCHLARANKVSGLLRVRKVVSNWFSIPFFRIGLKKDLKLHFRDGRVVAIKSQNEYFDFWASIEGSRYYLKAMGVKIQMGRNTVSFKHGGHTVKFWFDSKQQLANVLSLIFEQFGREQYKWLDVKGRVVVDIGANVGDTAIYFALNGAKHVYAFEPYPYSYGLARKNIKLNGLENKITLLNEGVSGKGGQIKIAESFKSDMNSSMRGFSRGKSIRVTTLNGIVRRFKIKNGALKSDCEGYEYPIFLKAGSGTLNGFDQMMIEYQYGYRNLVRKLEDEGFRARHTMPTYLARSKMFLGMIYVSPTS